MIYLLAFYRSYIPAFAAVTPWCFTVVSGLHPFLVARRTATGLYSTFYWLCQGLSIRSIKFYRIILVWKLSHGSIRSSSEAVFYDVAEEAISSSLYLTAVRTCRFPHSRLARNVFATLSCWHSDGGAGPNYVVCVWSLPRGTRCRTVLGY